jgi:HEAT repeat protein
MNLEQLKNALRDGDAEVRRRAVMSAAQESSREIGKLLLVSLGDEDWRVRKEAAHVLTRRAVELDLIEPLVSSICQGENVGLRNAALDVLEALGDRAASALIAALPGVPEHARKFVVEALGESGGALVVAELAKAAAADDPNVAGEAIEALARIGGPEAERIIRSRLRATDPFLRMAALDALNRREAVIPWEELSPLLEDRLLRRVAFAALGRTGRVEALEPLFQALEESTVHVVGAAAAAIAKLMATSAPARESATPRLLALHDRARAWLRAVLSSSSDAEARRAAAELLARARDTEALSAIVAHVSNEAPSPNTISAIREWGPDAVEPMLALVPLLESAQERAVALELTADLALIENAPESHSGDHERPRAHASPANAPRERVKGALRRGLSDREHVVVAAAARCLGQWADENDAALLVGHALAGDANVARACARALESLVKRAPEAVERALSSVALDGPNCASLASVIATLGGPRAMDRLQVLLSVDDSEVRRAALHGLGRVGGRRAAELVALALADEDASVQVVAAQVLGRLRDDQGGAPGFSELVSAVNSELSHVRAAVTRALGLTGSARAVEPLRELLRDPDSGVAMAAVEALGQLSPGELAESLHDALLHEDREVVKAALRALADCHDPAASDALISALTNKAWDVRQLSAELLSLLDVPRALPALRAQLATETDDLAREALMHAVVALGGEG